MQHSSREFICKTFFCIHAYIHTHTHMGDQINFIFGCSLTLHNTGYGCSSIMHASPHCHKCLLRPRKMQSLRAKRSLHCDMQGRIQSQSPQNLYSRQQFFLGVWCTCPHLRCPLFHKLPDLTGSLFLTLSLSLSLSLSLYIYIYIYISHNHPPTQTLSLTHTHTLSRTHSQSLTRSLTHSIYLFVCLYLCLSHTHYFSHSLFLIIIIIIIKPSSFFNTCPLTIILFPPPPPPEPSSLFLVPI